MKYLTEQQVKKYQKDGFLLLKNVFSEEEMEHTVIGILIDLRKIDSRP